MKSVLKTVVFALTVIVFSSISVAHAATAKVDTKEAAQAFSKKGAKIKPAKLQLKAAGQAVTDGEACNPDTARMIRQTDRMCAVSSDGKTEICCDFDCNYLCTQVEPGVSQYVYKPSCNMAAPTNCESKASGSGSVQQTQSK